MPLWLISLVTLCYFGCGLWYFVDSQPAWGFFWTAYAQANIAFMFATGLIKGV